MPAGGTTVEVDASGADIVKRTDSRSGIRSCAVASRREYLVVMYQMLLWVGLDVWTVDYREDVNVENRD
jgi:hypothetical protein